MIDPESALERVLAEGDEWQSWRALRASGDDAGEMPMPGDQLDEGGFAAASDRPSPGATGEALCHLTILGLGDSGAAAIAGDWLLEARTPAMAWLDPPNDVPGELDEAAGARVWATASATCGLLAVGRDPGPRALDLLRGESDQEGRFAGGAYPTFAAAGAFWLGQGPKTETAEWALRWAREWDEEWWGPWERVSGLTFWGAAGIPAEHPSVDAFLDVLRSGPDDGWPDELELTLRTVELLRFFGS